MRRMRSFRRMTFSFIRKKWSPRPPSLYILGRTASQDRYMFVGLLDRLVAVRIKREQLAKGFWSGVLQVAALGLRMQSWKREKLALEDLRLSQLHDIGEDEGQFP
ncbi:hypothetical protein P154DRAFT_312670 [Amniculicola lignicola CBS 123094]|uniref:Uncharacterized protein n=1 Tax=Amniculicola lignicola CBS 123094 TaxID=1392246 RepID=A0A6A5WXQ9_9PLEO|nr:hypothetical protein P154DRAFT_312670 [Amniculicola lignicola CBS 123094]